MMTLDVMGIAGQSHDAVSAPVPVSDHHANDAPYLTGFNHDFEIMSSHRKAKANELTEACDAVFNLPNRTPILLFFNRLIPIFGIYVRVQSTMLPRCDAE